MVGTLLPILARLILSGQNKEQARRYIKDKFSGFKEKALLAVFDVAWELASAAAGAQVGAVPFKDETTWLECAKVGLAASPEWQTAEA